MEKLRPNPRSWNLKHWVFVFKNFELWAAL